MELHERMKRQALAEFESYRQRMEDMQLCTEAQVCACACRSHQHLHTSVLIVCIAAINKANVSLGSCSWRGEPLSVTIRAAFVCMTDRRDATRHPSFLQTC